jgi:hypothetical protein
MMFKVYDIIEYSPQTESKTTVHNEFSFSISWADRETEKQIGEVTKINGNDMSIDWHKKGCLLHNSWWNMDSPRFRKIGERQIVLFNEN